MKILLVMLAILALVSLTACNTAPLAPATAVATKDVQIKDFTFEPNTISIKAGDTVTWTNLDNLPHQIASDTFGSDPIPQGQTYTHTFNTAGTYEYHCAIHSSMKHGFIVVS